MGPAPIELNSQMRSWYSNVCFSEIRSFGVGGLVRKSMTLRPSLESQKDARDPRESVNLSLPAKFHCFFKVFFDGEIGP